MSSLLLRTPSAHVVQARSSAAAATALAAASRHAYSGIALTASSPRTKHSPYHRSAKSNRTPYVSRSPQPQFLVTPSSSSRSFATAAPDMAALSAIKSNCRKVICIGRNFADHVKELNNQRPKQPFFFLKPPSSMLLPSEGPILRPRGVSLHYEVELALVMGRTLRDVDEADEAGWRGAIDSYLLAVDMTARNVQDEAKRKGLPWSIAKGFDTFLPVAGPIAAAAVPDPHAVDLWLKVNGQPKQDDSTELMLFRIGRQLSDISKVMTLEKGDIVLTGTPKGVGQVVTGDVIEAGMRVGGKEVEEARIRVEVADREGPYEFAET